MSIADKLTTIAENVKKVYNAGKASVDGYSDGVQAGKLEEQQAFWDVFQRSGRRNQYRNAFYDACWTDANYNPKYPIICSALSSSAFEYCGITDTKVDINFSHASSTNVFRNCASLKTIRKLIVTENVTFTGWFTGCTSLLRINFEGVVGQNLDLSYTQLSDGPDIENVVEHLKILDSGVTRTLSLSEYTMAIVNNYMPQIIAEITQKGWTVV